MTAPSVAAIVDAFVSEGMDPDGMDYCDIAAFCVESLRRSGYTIEREIARASDRQTRCRRCLEWNDGDPWYCPRCGKETTTTTHDAGTCGDAAEWARGSDREAQS